MFIKRVTAALKKSGVDFAIVGGWAVALHGLPRGTVDLDIVIKWQYNQLEATVLALESLGLVSRIPVRAKDVFQFRDEYVKERNLIGWNFFNPKNQMEQVDIIISFDLAKSEKVMMKGIPILSKNELIKMKEASGREQDLADVQALRMKL